MQKRPETLGEIIKTARDKSDLTVEELTARVGISERYLYRIENEGKVPTFEVLKKIVRELAIDGNLIFYPEKPVKDSEVEDLVRMLYSCDDRSLKIIRATVKAALENQTERNKNRADNHSPYSWRKGYRLCVLASGTSAFVIFSCFAFINVCLWHLGQNSGKFFSSVSSRICTLVLLPQTGHSMNFSFALGIFPPTYGNITNARLP